MIGHPPSVGVSTINRFTVRYRMGRWDLLRTETADNNTLRIQYAPQRRGFLFLRGTVYVEQQSSLLALEGC